MKLYLELLKKPVFTLEDVEEITHHHGSAKNQLVKLVDKGYAKRIRKNLYTCVSPETGLPIANKYQIASSITRSSYISHYTALEYYGYGDQVYYDVYVSSREKFKEFTFEGYRYKCVISNKNTGVIRMNYKVKITDIERTIVDSIKDMDKIAGIEEIISTIEIIPRINEEKVLDCLKEYENHFLYQKVGYLFEYYQDQLDISDTFLEECHKHIGLSKRYISKDIDCDTWNSKWNLGTSKEIFSIKNGG